MAAPTHDAVVHGGHDPDVDRTKQYIVVALILAAFTAIEVATYWFPKSIDTRLVTLLLVGLMIIKFGTVTAYFMHLKFDKRFLTVAFYSGLVLALAVYLSILTAFRWWSPSEIHVVPSGQGPAGQVEGEH